MPDSYPDDEVFNRRIARTVPFVDVEGEVEACAFLPPGREADGLQRAAKRTGPANTNARANFARSSAVQILGIWIAPDSR